MSGKRLLSTPSVAPLLVAPVSGGQSVTTANTAPANSPPETGASTPKGGRGWILTNGKVKTENYPPPPSLRSSSPLSQGDSQLQLQTLRQQTLPLRQGDS